MGDDAAPTHHTLPAVVHGFAKASRNLLSDVKAQLGFQHPYVQQSNHKLHLMESPLITSIVVDGRI